MNRYKVKLNNIVTTIIQDDDGKFIIPEQFKGLGSDLKPAVEEWILARKPLSEPTIAQNVLKWGTGGLAIDKSRVGFQSKADEDESKGKNQHSKYPKSVMRNPAPHGIYHEDKRPPEDYTATGRFPSNLILSCTCDEVREGVHTNKECPCYQLDEQSGNSKSKSGGRSTGKNFGGISEKDRERVGHNDKGGCSRFFKQVRPDAMFRYVPKPSRAERNRGCERLEEKEVRGGGGRANSGYDDNDIEQQRLKEAARKYGAVKAKKSNIHPTVKPITLMKYLITLITPPEGVVLDMFAGSGSTLVAAKELGVKFIGIEKEEEYVEICKARLLAVQDNLFS